MTVFFYYIMTDIRQPTNNLDEIYKRSEEAKPELTQLLDKIATETSGQVIIPPLKGRERTEEKIASDYNGDASKIKDVLRASIIYKNLDQVQSGLEKLQSEGNILEVKDRFAQPTSSGYRDALINVRTSNGTVAEIQLHLEPILEAKKEGHVYYEQERNIYSKAILENRDYTSEEVSQLDSLKAKQKELYDAAFLKAQGVEVSNNQPVKETPTPEKQQWAESILPTASNIFAVARQSNRAITNEAGIEIAEGNTYKLELNRNSQTLTIANKSDNREVAAYNLGERTVTYANPTLQDKQNWQEYAQNTRTNQQSNRQSIEL